MMQPAKPDTQPAHRPLCPHGLEALRTHLVSTPHMDHACAKPRNSSAINSNAIPSHSFSLPIALPLLPNVMATASRGRVETRLLHLEPPSARATPRTCRSRTLSLFPLDLPTFSSHERKISSWIYTIYRPSRPRVSHDGTPAITPCCCPPRSTPWSPAPHARPSLLSKDGSVGSRHGSNLNSARGAAGRSGKPLCTQAPGPNATGDDD